MNEALFQNSGTRKFRRACSLLISDSMVNFNHLTTPNMESLEFIEDYDKFLHEDGDTHTNMTESYVDTEWEVPDSHYSIEKHGTRVTTHDRHFQHGRLFKDREKVMYCKFSPDGKLLASSNSLGYLKMYFL